jgi:hypothetical protein
MRALQGLLQMISGPRVMGNHYSNYDEALEGFYDANQDKICDKAWKIGVGPGMYDHPSVSNMN